MSKRNRPRRRPEAGRCFGHYSTRDVARLIGLTEGACRQAMWRARISIADFPRVVAFILERQRILIGPAGYDGRQRS